MKSNKGSVVGLVIAGILLLAPTAAFARGGGGGGHFSGGAHFAGAAGHSFADHNFARLPGARFARHGNHFRQSVDKLPVTGQIDEPTLRALRIS